MQSQCFKTLVSSTKGFSFFIPVVCLLLCTMCKYSMACRSEHRLSPFHGQLLFSLLLQHRFLPQLALAVCQNKVQPHHITAAGLWGLQMWTTQVPATAKQLLALAVETAAFEKSFCIQTTQLWCGCASGSFALLRSGSDHH